MPVGQPQLFTFHYSIFIFNKKAGEGITLPVLAV